MFLYKLVFIFLLLFIPKIGLSKTEIIKTNMYIKDKTVYIDVESKLSLPQPAIQALKSGITLYFSYEFKIKSKRWYKIKSLAELKKNYEISYHPVTKQYLVKNPLTYEIKNFNTVTQLENDLANLKHFPLISEQALKEPEYDIAVRFVLDNHSAQEKLSLNTLFSDDWNLNSEWKTWLFPQN